MIKKIKTFIDVNVDNIFYLFLTVAVLYCGLSTTFIPDNKFLFLSLKLSFMIGLLFMLYKIYFIDKYKDKTKILLSLLFMLLFLCCHTAKVTNFFYYAIYLVACKNMNFNKICKIVLFSNLVVIFSAVILSNVGIIKNLIFHRSQTMLRYSFGFTYTMIFSAYVFFANVAGASLLIINYKKTPKYFLIAWLTLITISLDSLVLYKLTDTRTDLICNLFLIITLFSYLFIDKINSTIKIIGKYIMISLPIVFSLVTILSAILFNANNKFWLLADKIFSTRLSLTHQAYLKYPPKLIGQYFKQVGNGSQTHLKLGQVYFYIDNSFSRVLFMFGMIIFTLVIYAIFKAVFNLVNNNNKKTTYLAAIILILGMQGLFADDTFIISSIGLFIAYFGITKQYDTLINSNYNKSSNKK